MPSCLPRAAASARRSSAPVPADQGDQLVQQALVVAGVVDDRPAVLERQVVVVGELVRPDQVPPADLGPVQPEVLGDPVHRPLHGVAALRPAGAAVGRDDDGVGVDAVDAHPVHRDRVRADQLGGRHDRHDDPVGRVGAVVVPAADVQRGHPALVVVADGDLLALLALVRGGDEVLAAVLGPVHRLAQRDGGHRHQQLLGPRVHDLHAEPAAHVGGDDLDLLQRQLQLGRDRRAHRGGGLGGGVHPQRGVVARPTPRARPCPPSACRRCARCTG